MKVKYLFIILGILILIGSVNAFSSNLSESLTFTGNQNVTRYLSVPSNTILTNGFLTLTGNPYTNSDNIYYEDANDYYVVPFYIYMNYTKPNGYDSAKWRVRHGSTAYPEYNVTIPDNCFNQSKIILRFYSNNSQSGGTPNSYGQCYNGTDWNTITNVYSCSSSSVVHNTNSASNFYDGDWSTNTVYDNVYASGWTTQSGNRCSNIYEEGVYFVIKDSYPTNPSIYIGNNRVWNQSGIFNTNNVTNNLANSVNSYLSTCVYNSGFCQVPFTFHSDTSGILNYNNLIFNNNGFTENLQTFNNITSSFSTENYIINLTYDSNAYGLTGFLIYNGTSYTGTVSGLGNNIIISKSLSVPNVNSQSNVSFYWNIGLSNSSGTYYYNSSTNNQTINPISVDDCSINSIKILNYTIYDEDNQSLLNSTGMTFEADIKLSSPTNPNNYYEYNISKNNQNPITFCISNNTLNNSNYRMDVTSKYQAVGYVNRYSYIQNYLLTNSNIPQQITLFDLLTSRSQAFTITFKDSSYLPVQGAKIDIQRQYISQATYKSVENALTDSYGSGTVHLVLNDPIYNIIISKDGVILDTLFGVQAQCSSVPCTIDLNSVSTSNGTGTFQNSKNLNYLFTFDKTSRTYTVTFTTTDGSTTNISLNSIKLDAYMNDTVCSNSISSSSGTLTCVVPISYDNMTIRTSVYQDGNFLAYRDDSFNPLSTDIFGYTGLVLGAFAFLCLGLTAVMSGGISIIILSLIGLVFIGLMNLINVGGFLGIGATILYFVCAGIIIVWKLSKGRN